ncbi:MAG TPA: Gfo/Idh/MocA family oxidoreductase [Pyrinomonadaceae bacterium]
MLRLAIAGCGEHSRESHGAPLARYAARHAGEIELTAACDFDSERAKAFCRDFGFAKAYTDIEQMLATEALHGCISVMPVPRIVDVGTLLLEKKLPCVIEKPLGRTLAEIEQLGRVARETGTPHMVSVNRRFMPYLNRAILWAKRIGRLQYVRATQVRHARSEPDFIWSTAIHPLDALRHIAGDVTKFETKIRSSEGMSAIWYAISLSFASGATGLIEVLPTAGMVEESYELFGEGFRARVVAGSGSQRSLQCWHNGQLETDEQSLDTEPEDLRNGSYEEVEEFVGALKVGKKPRPTVEDILPSARICFAIASSLAQSANESVGK